tara:strand:- start:1061 stop:1780 length:720 start_codon:yes stop_codon:yes gene_type:complete
MNTARGMPDVSLKPETIERMNTEDKNNEKKPNSEIFTNPNLEMKVIPEDTVVETKVETKVEPKVAEVPKPKKKLTEKQLEALARGRQKSIETRKKAKEEKQNIKAQKEQQFVYKEPEAIAPPPRPTKPQSHGMNFDIDYDKIISGVANVYEKRLSDKKQAELEAEQKAQAVNSQVSEFEEKIREDERRRVKEHYDEQKKIKKQQIDKRVSHNVLSRPAENENPYAYAFSMNARNRFKRY